MTKELQQITNAVIQAIPVEKIFLFSSYAKGTQTSDSDYDIYIVMPDNSMRQHDATVRVYKSLAQKTAYKKPIDVITNYSSVFNERKNFPTLERIINKQGILLYEKK